MYSMKEACALTGMTYENLKFYCKEGLVPNVKRDSRNYRVFDDHDIKWIQSLGCLRNCGLSIAEMKEYLHLCLEGESSIPARKDILSRKKEGERSREGNDLWSEMKESGVLEKTALVFGQMNEPPGALQQMVKYMV